LENEGKGSGEQSPSSLLGRETGIGIGEKDMIEELIEEKEEKLFFNFGCFLPFCQIKYRM
jgi:hypothetical protein